MSESVGAMMYGFGHPLMHTLWLSVTHEWAIFQRFMQFCILLSTSINPALCTYQAAVLDRGTLKFKLLCNHSGQRMLAAATD